MRRNPGRRPASAARSATPPFHVAVAGPSVTAPLAALLDTHPSGLPAGVAYTPLVPLVTDLVGRGQRTTLVTLDAAVDGALAARGAHLDVLWGPYRRRHRMRDLMRAERTAVRKAVLHARPDLVHAHWCYEYALGALDSGVPTLVTVRDWIPAILRMMPTRARPYWTGRALMYFLTLARARYLTANSPYTAAKVRPFTRGALEVVPNGIPDDDFAAGDGDGLGAVAAARPIIVSVNNGFSPRKNVGALLRACQELRQGGLDVELRLVDRGYGPTEACSVWSRQQGLDECVTFAGALSHDAVRRTMREATVLAHPAREESFGTTLIEAMAQRLPVVAGAHSGAVPWVLDGGRAGLLVDVTDPRALAAALRAVITRPDLHAQLAAEGYRHAWLCFRQSHVTDLYQDAYRRVLAEEARA